MGESQSPSATIFTRNGGIFQNQFMIRTVIAVVDDMFFVSKIRATGKALGMIVKFPRTLDAFWDTVNDETPNLILVDLHNSKVDAISLAKELKTKENLSTIPLLGFFSHVQA